MRRRSHRNTTRMSMPMLRSAARMLSPRLSGISRLERARTSVKGLASGSTTSGAAQIAPDGSFGGPCARRLLEVFEHAGGSAARQRVSNGRRTDQRVDGRPRGCGGYRARRHARSPARSQAGARAEAAARDNMQRKINPPDASQIDRVETASRDPAGTKIMRDRRHRTAGRQRKRDADRVAASQCVQCDRAATAILSRFAAMM